MGLLIVVLILVLVAALIGISIFHFRKRREEGYASSPTRLIVLFAAALVLAAFIFVLVLWQFV